ncbi:LytTR family DNA-binding domain-containing protein [Fulvivirga kasyanovii]|uniref:Response regulator transcription factor n=1 Tax=Fulvivirga kasyanovii TaxID=396812 RepID=A0ABW9RM93_9BACT|nr:LytTR family DNA-binding domain-containing protein [Fulvivirga kasyanovii]MTI24469.1 response regulator transcription factor [Fulvivirga kasyanovii]
MNCIVIDDEFPARAIIESYISRIPYLTHLHSFKNPVEALDFLKKNKVDLMFVDIQMPELTGTEFLRSLQNKPAAIFTTAYPDYALEGYELDVIDYLVKPISFERFLTASEKAHKRIENLPKQTESYWIVKADHKTHRLRYSDINYIEGAREYVTYHLKEGKLMSLEALKNLEQSLPDNFIRIHKSYIVNKDNISSKGTQWITVAGKELPVGKSYRQQVRDLSL